MKRKEIDQEKIFVNHIYVKYLYIDCIKNSQTITTNGKDLTRTFFNKENIGIPDMYINILRFISH